jgi:subtilisin family serine protease
MNGMGAWLSDNQVKKIAGLPFVKAVQPMIWTGKITQKNGIFSSDDSLTFYYQLKRFEADLLAAHHLSGKGIRIAIFDIGFKSANKHVAFKAVFDSGHVLKTYDFIKNRPDVYSGGEHGTMVMSCIAGKYENRPMGMAPDATFLLARTERNFVELLTEEDNWLAAAEWADKNGAQIISCSLGYTNNHYFVKDMNGHTSIISRAANLAARKGILVITAAGNDGDDNWKYICTPADADSVLTVGGIDPITNYHIDFSSYGPTADGRMKPDVTGPGEAWVAVPDGGFTVADGTSFSTPLVAGFAACLLQLYPALKPEQAIDYLHKAGSLYPYFDYAHGFGTPQASRILSSEKHNDTSINSPKIEIASMDSTLEVNITDERWMDTAGNYSDSTPYLYYKILDSAGHITSYSVVRVQQTDVLSIPISDLPPKGSIIIHYEKGKQTEFHY